MRLPAAITDARWPRRGKVPAFMAGLVVAGALAFAAVDDAPLVRRNTEAYYGLKDAGLGCAGRRRPKCWWPTTSRTRRIGPGAGS